MIYPIGIQNFESLRNDGYVYVDKTAHIHRLVSTGRYYFLSRPRRFGKSLLVSTMYAYFSGRKELFEGLALEQLEQKWTKHPILHLDLNTGKYDSEDSLDVVLNKTLTQWELEYGTDASEVSFELRFLGIVQRACEKTGERVVILVDEYDKPLLQAIGNDDLQTKYRNTLKAFYSVLKTQDQYIKFGFLTGVTKHCKGDFFYEIDCLQDISMDGRYVDICGITNGEIKKYFGDSILDLTNSKKMTSEDVYSELDRLYGGFCFAPSSENIYNPSSLLATFKCNEFRHYWYETGTPSFLKYHVLKHTTFDLADILQGDVECDSLYYYINMKNNPIPLIYQSGYLTIKSYDERFKLYRLGFPNKEVEQGFKQLSIIN